MSRSLSPIATLRKLLNIPGIQFCRRHKISHDTLKKIESRKSALLLPKSKALEIAIYYGLLPEPLYSKTAALLAIDGTPASVDGIESWRDRQPPDKLAAKKITRQTIRRMHRLFIAATDAGELFELSFLFENWLQEFLANRKKIKPLFDAQFSVSKKTKFQVTNIKQLEKFLGKTHPLIRAAAALPIGGKDLPNHGKYTVLMEEVKLNTPSVSFQKHMFLNTLVVVYGKEIRRQKFTISYGKNKHEYKVTREDGLYTVKDASDRLCTKPITKMTMQIGENWHLVSDSNYTPGGDMATISLESL